MDDIARETVTDETEMTKERPRQRRKEPVEADDGGVPDDAGAPAAPMPAANEAQAARPLNDPAELSRVLLALLLVNREALPMLRLAQACDTTQDNVQQALERLQQDLQGAGFPLEVQRAGESVRLLTLPEVYPYVERLKGQKKVEKLSPAALETLAVIAYRQPVMRAEIEAIRGVQAGPVLRSLLEHKLVRITGRADVPGRPLQYGTTQKFLERFGLPSLKDLPSIKEFRSLGS